MIKNLLFLPLLLTLMLLVNGCSSPGYFEPTPIAQPGNGMLYIYRPAADNPGRQPLRYSYPEILVSDKSVGFLKYKEYLTVELPPGKYEVVATGLTRNANWSPRNVSYKATIEAGKETFLKLRVAFNLDEMMLLDPGPKYFINLFPVNAEDAVYEIRDTSAATQ